MLIKLSIKNFKRFDDVVVDLGNPVVFIGPNNSGKTTALQALALWSVGLNKWLEVRGGKKAPKERSGVTINRRDLIAVPVPNANLLWRNLHTRDVQRKEKLETKNVRIDIVVEGINEGNYWKCGLEFDYANPESFYCRPLRISEESNERMKIPNEATKINVAYLPPMSGLVAIEPRYFTGRINVLIGEGRTAEVLRNLCYNLIDPEKNLEDKWNIIVEKIQGLFGVKLKKPVLVEEKGEIILEYLESNIPKSLDITSSGRGLHQTLLLLSWLYSNPNSILLIDEPDAHLEILRQREIYQILTEIAKEQNCQIIAASHSEVVLNEAAQNSTLIAFLGKPHRIDDKGTQVLKSLKSIGFDQYLLAEQMGWVLYLEGSTDLVIIRSFAKKLDHPVLSYLERPFIKYVGNQPSTVEEHFYGVLEAKNDLKGIAIFDNIDREIRSNDKLTMIKWTRNEIENYFFFPEVLEKYALGEGQPDITKFSNKSVMNEIVKNYIPPVAYKDRNNEWWMTIKASNFLESVFNEYFKVIGLPNVMRKSNFHILAEITPKELIPEEVKEKLDAIYSVAKNVKVII